MAGKDVTGMRGTIEFLRQENELLIITEEVDPVLEIAAILKALDDGPALLFENIKGYPGVRNVGNVLCRRDRIAKIFDVPDWQKTKFKCLEAMKHPIPPRVVEKAPCQEVVITKGIDVMATLPILKHTPRDGARILGSSNMLISGDYYRGGFHINFSRMSFRGKDWSSIPTWTGTHIGEVSLVDHVGEKIPVTANICTPPAVLMVAGTFFLHDIVPRGSDKLGFAGALQGAPVEIVKAKTVDAYAIAQAEWVLEGYIHTDERVWETEEAEKLGRAGVAPFFPEWPGFLGRAYRPRKFQVTAITHRNDPIFFTPLARSWDADVFCSPFREACFYEMADRIFPGLVVDVNIVPGIAAWGGNVVFQVRKSARRFEGPQRTILQAALNLSQGLRLVIAVDEDIDIYSTDDLLWAITTRVDPRRDIIVGAGGGVGQRLMPSEKVSGADPSGQYRFEGGIGFDATVPFDDKWSFERAHHASDQIDLRKWFSKADIARVRAMQSDYARYMGETGR